MKVDGVDQNSELPEPVFSEPAIGRNYVVQSVKESFCASCRSSLL